MLKKISDGLRKAADRVEDIDGISKEKAMRAVGSKIARLGIKIKVKARHMDREKKEKMDGDLEIIVAHINEGTIIKHYWKKVDDLTPEEFRDIKYLEHEGKEMPVVIKRVTDRGAVVVK